MASGKEVYPSGLKIAEVSFITHRVDGVEGGLGCNCVQLGTHLSQVIGSVAKMFSVIFVKFGAWLCSVYMCS